MRVSAGVGRHHNAAAVPDPDWKAMEPAEAYLLISA